MQRHGSKYCAPRPSTPTPSSPPSVRRSKLKCSSMIVNILPADLAPHPPDPGDRVKKCQEHGHVAYQIKGIIKYSSMVANSLPQTPPQPPPPPILLMWSKGQNETFSEHGHFAYQIKEKHECSNMVANIVPADPLSPTPLISPIPGDGVKMSKLNFLEHGHVAHQIKENRECSNMGANILPTDPLPSRP